MLQVYTREDFEGAIYKVPSDVSVILYEIISHDILSDCFVFQKRGFRVPLALEFRTHFLAFVTLDNLFCVRLWPLSCPS